MADKRLKHQTPLVGLSITDIDGEYDTSAVGETAMLTVLVRTIFINITRSLCNETNLGSRLTFIA